ncbi:PP2C family protein-serine/threonine phosphatase [Zavarzinella formosa]|uniref:PP2C family protein-serine/threonine phosphatase n=1 Tax=Zavarzinella formosa TaxID=360055 RepID=UPI000308157A|nr:SpoIIE family protein phosphatase [Zavarzinella formosa]
MKSTNFFDSNPESRSDRLDLTIDVMRELSRARDPQAMYRVYARRMAEIFPTDRQISLSRRGLVPPAVRVTRFNLWQDHVNPWKEPERLPVLAGGILGKLVAEGKPGILNRLEVPDNDPAAPYLEGQRSLMALPLYEGGESVNMVVVTRSEPDAFTPDHLPELVWMSNLFGRATQAAVLSQKLHTANEQAQHELRQVAKLQQALLPTELPRVSTLDLSMYSRSTATAGGDFYDVIRLPRNRVGLLVADVCGHGASAAMLVAVLHSLVKTYTGPPFPPGHLLTYVNDHLTKMYTRSFGTFVTAVYAIYDPDRGTLSWSNAGHPPPRITRVADGSVEVLERKRSVPLGIVDGTEYPEDEVSLKPGDQVLLHTDGITDAKTADDESFGTERLDKMLGDCPSGAKGIIKRILDSLDRFTKGAPLGDDYTLIAMKFIRSKKKAGELSGEFRAVNGGQDM